MRLLIADDNRDAALSLAVLLEMAGHEVRVAYDGRKALDASADWSPHVVILDIDMPVMDGLKAAKEFRIRFPKVTLVALSGKTDLEVRPLVDAGFDMFFAKGVPFHDLRRALDRSSPDPS